MMEGRVFPQFKTDNVVPVVFKDTEKCNAGWNKGPPMGIHILYPLTCQSGGISTSSCTSEVMGQEAIKWLPMQRQGLPPSAEEPSKDSSPHAASVASKVSLSEKRHFGG